MTAEIAGIGVGLGIGVITSKQDIEMHKINVLYTIPAFLVSLFIYPAIAVATMVFLALMMGKIMEFGKAWKDGDTWLLMAYSALTLDPPIVLAGALSIYILYKIAKGNVKKTLPFAPFLFMGFLLAVAWRWVI